MVCRVDIQCCTDQEAAYSALLTSELHLKRLKGQRVNWHHHSQALALGTNILLAQNQSLYEEKIVDVAEGGLWDGEKRDRVEKRYLV